MACLVDRTFGFLFIFLQRNQHLVGGIHLDQRSISRLQKRSDQRHGKWFTAAVCDDFQQSRGQYNERRNIFPPLAGRERQW